MVSDPTQHPSYRRRYEASKALRLARQAAADYIEVGRFVGDLSHDVATRIQRDIHRAREEYESADTEYNDWRESQDDR